MPSGKGRKDRYVPLPEFDAAGTYDGYGTHHQLPAHMCSQPFRRPPPFERKQDA